MNFQYDRICVMVCARGDDRSRGSKEGCCQAEEKAAAEQALREKHEAKVVEAKRELQETMKKCETLEQSLTEKESELARSHQAMCDARGETQDALQEIQEAREITAGIFAELPRSISDAAQFYRAEEGNTVVKLFWPQYLAPNYPVPFTDQLKQLIKLHKAAELAIKV
ncbi:uncharacterized protein LOC125524538 [Triticum urartu]|uniref:uncharacterized protein LOC125524538 n=1 Tax=Triticum urartu TaxID=4572 RepID=UPI0020441CE5|nr:uncharacterized protein LOC125524538 [Triticum urartu]